MRGPRRAPANPRLRNYVCIVSVLGAVALPCFAVEATAASNYIETNFTAEDGLSSNVVNTITQTRNGLLWIGTTTGLLRFDGHACEDWVSNRSMAFNITVKGAARDIHPIIRDDIHRIGFEAIRNACAHSKGTKLDLELSYERDLILKVRDDGTGITPELLARGNDKYFGLKRMQERAARIGAKLSSHAKAPGTEVELCVPRKIAFREKRIVF